MISIVIPCRNEATHIGTCVETLLRQDIGKVTNDWEIVVADGDSDDGTREILAELSRQHPCLRVVDNPERIAASGLNRAIRAAHGEIIVRADAHTEYSDNYVRLCVETLKRTGADNVGGPARIKGHSYLQNAMVAAFASALSTGGTRNYNYSYSGWVDTVAFGCWPKSVFERVGYFDESLVRNQDDEHNLRILQSGGRIWQSADIYSWRYPRATLAKLFQQYYEYGYWKVKVIRKHRSIAAVRHIIPALFVTSWIALAVLALLSGKMRLLFVVLSATYLMMIGIGSLVTAWRSSWRFLPVLPGIFVCFHWGYGSGFLRALWSLRRGES